jgi:hypothetical protein
MIKLIDVINLVHRDPRVPRRRRRSNRFVALAVLPAILGCGHQDRDPSRASDVSGALESTSGHADRSSPEVAANPAAETAHRPEELAIPTSEGAGVRESTLGEPPASPRIIELEGGVRAWIEAGRVEFPGEIILETGWLEVAVCRRSTREHESIVVADVVPSVVHAALLLAGFEPGAPAGWDEATNSPIPPRGPLVTIELRFGPSGPDGPDAREVPLESMIEDARERGLPTWVFAGSLVRPNPPSMGEGEYFLADYAGTFIGLTTFGDEVIAAQEVRSPETGVDPPVWRIREGAVPPVGTAVTVVVRRPVPPSK